MDKFAGKVNVGEPDPLTNRVMSDACWNSKHAGQNKDTPVCQGWIEQCEKCERKHGEKIASCACLCHQRKCKCACHDPKIYRPNIKRDPNANMSIMETGCGVIEIKRGK